MTAVDSPEKILFTSTTQAFLHKEAPVRRVRELHAAGQSFDRAWWRRAAELGWTGLLVPEELGGGSVSESTPGWISTVSSSSHPHRSVTPGSPPR
ncbi:acyl-CoA dehydrogenase family protein [Mycobacterium sp. 050134]|uniref:acyl-CoA dehydrogenase family protein n=1 Tax=Mycobacterium sp. 050134 TaxID=3096111 RepID=UPI003FA55134